MYRVQCLPLPSDCHVHNRQKAEGYLTVSFFNNFGYEKPAVTIFVFDTRSQKDFDWSQIEQLSILQMHYHSEHWQQGRSVASKYVIIYLVPESLTQYQINQYQQSFKRNNHQDKHITKAFVSFLQSLSPLTNAQTQKPFIKKIHDLVFAYY